MSLSQVDAHPAKRAAVSDFYAGCGRTSSCACLRYGHERSNVTTSSLSSPESIDAPGYLPANSRIRAHPRRQRIPSNCKANRPAGRCVALSERARSRRDREPRASQNCEKNFQIAGGSSDHVLCPPGNSHQKVGALQPWYSTHGLGFTGWVWVPHWLRARYLSRAARPRAVVTNVSLFPWKAMIGSGRVYVSSGMMTCTSPEHGAIARNTSNSKPTA